MNKHNIQQDKKKKTITQVCLFVLGLIYTETEH